MGQCQVSMRRAWPYGMQPHLLRTVADLRIVVELLSLELGDLGGELGNLRERVVDGHLSRRCTV